MAATKLPPYVREFYAENEFAPVQDDGAAGAAEADVPVAASAAPAKAPETAPGGEEIIPNLKLDISEVINYINMLQQNGVAALAGKDLNANQISEQQKKGKILGVYCLDTLPPEELEEFDTLLLQNQRDVYNNNIFCYFTYKKPSNRAKLMHLLRSKSNGDKIYTWRLKIINTGLYSNSNPYYEYSIQLKYNPDTKKYNVIVEVSDDNLPEVYNFFEQFQKKHQNKHLTLTRYAVVQRLLPLKRKKGGYHHKKHITLNRKKRITRRHKQRRNTRRNTKRHRK